jgi:hypothetical protein
MIDHIFLALAERGQPRSRLHTRKRHLRRIVDHQHFIECPTTSRRGLEVERHDRVERDAPIRKNRYSASVSLSLTHAAGNPASGVAPTR